MALVDLIASTRTDFMKLSSIMNALDAAKERGGQLQYRLINTGSDLIYTQKVNMFTELGIRTPRISMEIGTGNPLEELIKVMTTYERGLTREPSDMCLVVGDSNAALGCAFVAKRKGMTVAHVESGVRTNDRSMPEEINRLMTDSITDWYFTTSETAKGILLRARVEEERIFCVGSTLADMLQAQMSKLRPAPIWGEAGLKAGEYLVIVLRQQKNLTFPEQIRSRLLMLAERVRKLPMLFLVNPNTAKIIKELGCKSFHCLGTPQYLELTHLVQHAKAVITDSGWLSEETTLLGVPCVTLQEYAEIPETVTVGTNELIGKGKGHKDFYTAMKLVLDGKWKKGEIPEKWDGRAGERIAEELGKKMDNGKVK